MNDRYGYRKLIASTLLSVSMLTATCSGVASAGDDKSSNVQRKTGYEIDGRTTASVIVAKRSHAVSDRDQIGLAVFSEVFAIGLIAFFAQIMNEKK